MKILLLEDDPQTAAFIRKGLEQAGFTVAHSGDGLAGLVMAQEEEFDLAVVDVMLPRLDGFGVVRKLRATKPNVPVIILSARDAVEDRVKGLESGSDDYVTKPFAFVELLARIHALLRRATAAAEPTVLTYEDLTLDLLGRLDVLVRRKMIHYHCDFFAVKDLIHAKLSIFCNSDRRGYIVAQNKVKIGNYKLSRLNLVKPRVGGKDFLCHCHAHSVCYSPFCDNIYSNESVRAVKLASITSLETPMVVQLSSPFVDSISTRILAAVVLLISITRTLKSDKCIELICG